ncbi:hypothetical protein N9Y26_00635 [bacterium]|nr:hypothetical protein [bacterium]
MIWASLDNRHSKPSCYLVKKKGIWYYKSRSKGTKLNVNANKLNNTFAEHLKNYELRDGLEKPFKQLVSYAFSKYHSNKHFDLKQLSQLTYQKT